MTMTETPAGLPDEAALTALANGMFPDLTAAALPEAAAVQSLPGSELPAAEAAAREAAGTASLPGITPSAASDAPLVPEAYATPADKAAVSQAASAVPGVSAVPSAALPSAESGRVYAPKVISIREAGDYERHHRLPAARPVQDAVSSQTLLSDSSVRIGSRTLGQIRADFPILSERINGQPLVWLDNGATTQRPQTVIDRIAHYYAHENSNVHRGAHTLAARSTDAYEDARQTVRQFIGAPSADEIVFVRGTTEGINLVAASCVRPLLQPGDEIILSVLEHHANIVPWQLIAAQTGAVIRVIPCDETGQLVMSEYEKLFTPRTRFVSVTHVSNVLGTVTPVEELISIAHRHGVRILIDAAQSIAHIPLNVAALDPDFLVFSGHKVFGPTGIGAVYGRRELWEAAEPYHGGGNMIADVTFERTVYNTMPNKFEAGTGSIADAVGLGEALKYLSGIGMSCVQRWEHELLEYARREMQSVRGLHLIGNAAARSSSLAFKLDGHEDAEVGQRLDSFGIAVRTGHHCAQPVLRRFGLESAVRPTVALYNSPSDIDAMVRVLRAMA